MGELYDADVLEWSKRQAELLRRRAAGELVNEADLDWPNIAEEIESVGRDQLHAVESLLLQGLLHMLKAEAWPLSRDAPAWRAEAIRFRAQASNRYTPSMRRRLISTASTGRRSARYLRASTARRRCRCNATV